MPINYSYRVVLENTPYSLISFPIGKRLLILSKTNKRPVHCAKCATRYTVGECVWHKQYRTNYYICISCAKDIILRNGRNGFIVNFPYVQALDTNSLQYTAQQVSQSIQKFVVSKDVNGIETLSQPGE